MGTKSPPTICGIDVFPSRYAMSRRSSQEKVNGCLIMADDANGWGALHGHYMVKRTNHQVTYSDGIACTNSTESLFIRLRRLRTVSSPKKVACI